MTNRAKPQLQETIRHLLYLFSSHVLAISSVAMHVLWYVTSQKGKFTNFKDATQRLYENSLNRPIVHVSLKAL